MIKTENEVVFAIGVLLDFEVTLQMRSKLCDLCLEWRCVVLVNKYQIFDGVGEVGQTSGSDSSGATLTWPETVRRAVLGLSGLPAPGYKTSYLVRSVGGGKQRIESQFADSNTRLTADSPADYALRMTSAFWYKITSYIS